MEGEGATSPLSFMEILTRSKNNNETEIIPSAMSQSDIVEEVNSRTAKAGYTTKNGEYPYRTKIMTMPPTKGFGDNYRRAFGHD